MLDLGLLAFAHPWLLTALAALPVLWLLLRVIPPAPKRFAFPAVRLLQGLAAKEETPAKTPLWLVLLRMAIAALIILALAQPLLHPENELTGSGPLVLVVDNGWSAARHWPRRQAAAEQLLAQAERDGRSVGIFPTARPADDSLESPHFYPAGEARQVMRQMRPQAWPADRSSVLAELAAARVEGSANVVWLSDGLAGADSETTLHAFAAALQKLGRLDMVTDHPAERARLLLPPQSDGQALTLHLLRSSPGPAEAATVTGHGDDGHVIASAAVTFPDGSLEAEGRLALPAELRNRISLLRIDGEQSAGATVLLDERWRRRPVGILTGSNQQDIQPLLSEIYYLRRALEPFTELRDGDMATLFGRDLAVAVLPDSAAALDAAQSATLDAWIEKGGLLLRFAGPHLAENPQGPLPVSLRGGDRILGGSMTWDRPARLAPFDPDSPFAGLSIPNDVVIKRQVLAEPSLDLTAKTWAKLTDGTPLVTAERRGKGWLVLFHTTANNDWSNLPLSGLFVEMLQRILEASQGIGAGEDSARLAALSILDGFGVLGPAPALTQSLTSEALNDMGSVDPQHPPGYYGDKGFRRAHNLGGDISPPAPIGALPAGVSRSGYDASGEQDLKPLLLVLAIVLALADFIVSLIMRGHGRPRGRRQNAPAATAVLLMGLALGLGLTAWPSGPAGAQQSGPAVRTDDARAIEATEVTRLAYVETGDVAVDETSYSGLAGLSRVLRLRTSIEAGSPMGVDPETDELAFFPLLYWPVAEGQEPMSPAARRNIETYMANGGTILFDLRDPTGGAQFLGQASRSTASLQRLLEGVEIPPLAPVPPDHVLTKAFYLLQDFPGRYAGGALWVEEGLGADKDGVASIVIGSNDWAGAWAINELGQPLNVVVPGGARQREMAYRFGVNLVMYALTGNYKSDQVHVPFILERLGQ
jgi:hypothetical protein